MLNIGDSVMNVDILPVDEAAAAVEGHADCGETASAASRGTSRAACPRDSLTLLPGGHKDRARSAAPWPAPPLKAKVP